MCRDDKVYYIQLIRRNSTKLKIPIQGIGKWTDFDQKGRECINKEGEMSAKNKMLPAESNWPGLPVRKIFENFQ